MPDLTETQLKQLIRTQVAEVLIRHDQEFAQGAQSQPQPKENHAHHVVNCPECFQDTLNELKRTSTSACEDCGQPLGNEEFAKKLPECPMCHSKKAMKALWNESKGKMERVW